MMMNDLVRVHDTGLVLMNLRIWIWIAGERYDRLPQWHSLCIILLCLCGPLLLERSNHDQATEA